MFRLYHLSIFALLLIYDLQAQEIFPPRPNSQKLRIEAQKASSLIKIDGLLNEVSWSTSETATHFIQSSPNQGDPASYETFVKVLYDDEYLYVGAICMNDMSQILVQDLRRDFTYSENELFGVFFDPFQDVQNPVPSFLVTPFGSQRDLLIYDDRIYDLNWDAVWKAKSHINDSSWSAELAIPWSTLRYPADATTWGINFNRNIRNKYEITGWSPWPRAYTVGRMSYAGLVTNLHPPKRGANVRFSPYVIQNASKSPTQTEHEFNTEVGGEVKWLLNTNTSLEGTINTDFAQADVDRQVINLNRSSVFFPERRQFFLENANLFSVGLDGIVQPFFSRRIGLDSTGRPLQIDGGVRLIHQSSERAFGLIAIRQSDLSDRKTDFGVLRYQENLKDSRIGALLTYRHDQSIRQTNLVAAIDGFWRISQPLYIRPMVSATLPTNGGNYGWAFMTEVAYLKNNLTLSLKETYVENDYKPKSGFLSRTNFINTRPEIFLALRKSWLGDRVRFFIPSIRADIFHETTSGDFLEAALAITPFRVRFRDGGEFGVDILPTWQTLKNDLPLVPGVTIPVGRYQYLRHRLSLMTNQSARYSILADVSIGQFYNGSLQSYSATLRFAPIVNIVASINYSLNRFQEFEPTNKTTTHLFSPEIRLSLNPKIQLTGIYQHNTATNLGGLNARFSWEYRPLSFIYLVYNGIRTIDSQISPPSNAESSILKISYIKQL